MGIVCSPLKKKFKASANAGAFSYLQSGQGSWVETCCTIR
nr:MAG TPA: hypothetical protein [Caudoviricetes sp.]DAQ16106.1 MAG TPA: hypothetical protein [Caudoviricetes sp.]